MRNCVTHHHACDCREEKFRLLEQKNNELEKEIKLKHSWVKHHQKSAELALERENKLKRGIKKVRDEIIEEIERMHRHPNIGKTGCVKRLNKLLKTTE